MESDGGPAADVGPRKVLLPNTSLCLLPRWLQPEVSQSALGVEHLLCAELLCAQCVVVTFRVAAHHPFPLILAKAFRF